jgi:hypothetical protein
MGIPRPPGAGGAMLVSKVRRGGGGMDVTYAGSCLEGDLLVVAYRAFQMAVEVRL